MQDNSPILVTEQNKWIEIEKSPHFALYGGGWNHGQTTIHTFDINSQSLLNNRRYLGHHHTSDLSLDHDSSHSNGEVTNYKFELNDKGLADISIPTAANEPSFTLKV